MKLLLCNQKGNSMPKDDMIRMNGVVVDNSHGIFKIQLENGNEVRGNLSGKLRQKQIHILNGDKVTLEFSVMDTTQGRIVYRIG